LRERKEDITELIHYFINKLNIKMNKDIMDISQTAMAKIMSYSWPGNIRELENTVERAVNLCNGGIIGEEDIFIENLREERHTYLTDAEGGHKNMDIISENEIEPLEDVEKRAIERALNISGGNITITANLLKVTRNTIYNKMKKYNLSGE